MVVGARRTSRRRSRRPATCRSPVLPPTRAQVGATNVNLPVRVLSPGNDGSVDQSNKVDSKADASNHNSTTQTSDQDQSGSGGCGCASDPIQVAQQSSGSLQGAFALSAADQLGAENSNTPVRVGSSGNGGSVDQSNKVKSDASATNWNSTDQSADQDQGSSRQPVRLWRRCRDPGAGTELRQRPGRSVGLRCVPGLRQVGVRLQLGRQLQRPGPCLEPRQRRFGRPVEQGRVEG